MPIGSLALQISSVTDEPMITQDQKTLTAYFSFKLTGNYPTGGDPLDLTQLFAASAGGPGASLPTGALPLRVELMSGKSGGGTTLFEYSYSPNAAPTLSNGTVQVFTGAAAQSGLAELSAGAYPAGVTGDLILGKAIFPKL